MKLKDAYELIKSDCTKYFGNQTLLGIVREYQRLSFYILDEIM